MLKGWALVLDYLVQILAMSDLGQILEPVHALVLSSNNSTNLIANL